MKQTTPLQYPRKAFFMFVGSNILGVAGLGIGAGILAAHLGRDLDSIDLASKEMIAILLLIQQVITGITCILSIYIGEYISQTPHQIEKKNNSPEEIPLATSQTLTTPGTRQAIYLYFADRFQRKGWSFFWKRTIGGIVVYMIFTGSLSGILDYFQIIIPGFNGEQDLITMLENLQLNSFLNWTGAFLLIAIVGPLFEEIAYRGIVTDILTHKRGYIGLAIAACIFSLVHMEFAVFRNLALLAVFMGYIYRKTGSLRYSFLFHMIINTGALIALGTYTG